MSTAHPPPPPDPDGPSGAGDDAHTRPNQPRQGGSTPPGGYPQPGYPQPGYPQAGGYPPPGDPAHGGAGALAHGDPLVATSFSDWWSKVIGVLARSWQPLLVVQVATVVPAMILGAVLTAAAPGPSAPLSIAAAVLAVVAVLVVVVVALVAQGASVYVVAKQASGERVGAGTALRFAAGRAVPLLGWGILAALLTAVGLLLLLVPGVYLAVVFAATLTGVIMFERAGIERTFALVNPAFGGTFLRLLSFGLGALVYSAVVGAVVGVLVDREGFVGGLLDDVLTLPVTFASVGVAVVTYASLRHRENPAVTTRALAAELDRP